jgi:hypothetical protein
MTAADRVVKTPRRARLIVCASPSIFFSPCKAAILTATTYVPDRLSGRVTRAEFIGWLKRMEREFPGPIEAHKRRFSGASWCWWESVYLRGNIGVALALCRRQHTRQGAGAVLNDLRGHLDHAPGLGQGALSEKIACFTPSRSPFGWVTYE